MTRPWTKGPWVKGAPKQAGREVGGIYDWPIYAQELSAVDVATVHDMGTAAEAPANAQLIALAPEMADALEKFAVLLAFHEGSAKPKVEGGHPVVWINGEDFRDMLAVARAILARLPR